MMFWKCSFRYRNQGYELPITILIYFANTILISNSFNNSFIKFSGDTSQHAIFSIKKNMKITILQLYLFIETERMSPPLHFWFILLPQY